MKEQKKKENVNLTLWKNFQISLSLFPPGKNFRTYCFDEALITVRIALSSFFPFRCSLAVAWSFFIASFAFFRPQNEYSRKITTQKKEKKKRAKVKKKPFNALESARHPVISTVYSFKRYSHCYIETRRRVGKVSRFPPL